MTKTRHIHALKAHVELALEYDPNDLQQLTTLNTQIREAVRKLPGFVDVKFSLGKIPAPVTKDGPISQEPEPLATSMTGHSANPPSPPAEGSDTLEIPAFMARKK